jgi:hypothetical protein
MSSRTKETYSAGIFRSPLFTASNYSLAEIQNFNQDFSEDGDEETARLSSCVFDKCCYEVKSILAGLAVLYRIHQMFCCLGLFSLFRVTS